MCIYHEIAKIEEALQFLKISPQSIINHCVASGRSFRWHPLGFIVCNVLSEGARKVRLHIWPANGSRRQDSECQIHDHFFEFTSYVLLGAVENINYKIDEYGSQFALYETSYYDNQSILTKLNQSIRLSVANTQTFKAGKTYQMEAGKLHETRRISTELAITILISNDVLTTRPLVIGPLSGPKTQVYMRSELTRAELTDAITGISMTSD
jgi:hypothetical protein